jgi:hypothetical protein
MPLPCAEGGAALLSAALEALVMVTTRSKLVTCALVTAICIGLMDTGIGQGQRPLPEFAAARMSEWYFWFIVWQILHYGLGITALVLSTIVGTVTFSPPNEPKKRVMSVVAAACTGLIVLLNPGVLRNAYIEAWRILDSASRQYVIDANTTDKALSVAIDAGERVLARAGL